MLLRNFIFLVVGIGVARTQSTTRAVQDQISTLPGLTFETKFSQYSGYLWANDSLLNTQVPLHYWFIESTLPSAPLILWLNGGPGCSSMAGVLEEIGPFRPSEDGSQLNENVFSWNKVAHLLFLDAPSGTGFSPSVNANTDDNKVAWSNYLALTDFFSVFPNAAANGFYLAGEGYGSVYVTTLGYTLLQQISANNFTQPFKGIMIGNGALSGQDQFNSLIEFAYVKGLSGQAGFDLVKQACNCEGTSSLGCDYYSAQRNMTCKQPIQEFIAQFQLDGFDQYNMNQECYRMKKVQMGANKFLGFEVSDDGSTDPLDGFPCYSNNAAETYLSRADVQRAINVFPISNGKSFKLCTTLPNYTQLQHGDLHLAVASVIKHRIWNEKLMKLLFFNGDLDTVYNHIGAQWFIEKQELEVQNETYPWMFGYDTTKYKASVGGYVKRFSNGVDFTTVKGAGHFVPMYRPGQALQLALNFINNTDYNTDLRSVNLNISPVKPVNNNGTKTADERKAADQIHSLPGLTFEINFKQYAGYLKSTPTHNIFYWMMMSQNNPETAPTILWLTGGPGSASMRGGLTENGPFKVNKDGRTLFENPYSWNKFANIFYIETPRGVGFSYQDSVDQDYTYNNNYSQIEHVGAIKDFFNNVFPELKKNEFYIIGESYAGTYIPMMSALLIQEIQHGNIEVNFKGVAIQNGYMSHYMAVKSIIFQSVTYGLMGQNEYDEIITRCCNATDPTECDLSQYLYMDQRSNLHAKPDKDPWCGQQIEEYAWDDKWGLNDDPYQLYLECWSRHASWFKSNRPSTPNNFTDYASLMNWLSTDQFDGFPCWGAGTAEEYLRRAEVRNALHVPPFVGVWDSHNTTVIKLYVQNDTIEMYPYFDSMINSYFFRKNNMSILIFNGDADQVCNHLGGQWMAENLTSSLGMKTLQEMEYWYYQKDKKYMPTMAGSVKIYDGLHFATVNGAGHMVPLDRPGPGSQLIYNYIMKQPYNSSWPFSLDLSPKLPGYQALAGCAVKSEEADQVNTEKEKAAEPPAGAPELTDRAKADQIQNLPGLTFNINFRQFSGYLTPDVYPTHHLFYWFVESQNDPVNDPVVLWLNGGPGCSSLSGFFEGLGPFHNNNDNGTTLFENVYTWNKKANVLFLEGPVGVGFSYFEEAEWINTDDSTAEDNAYALVDFFKNVFPEYAKNEFFVTGESYAGVYGPTLTLKLEHLINANQLTLNLKGMAIGNGILSEYLQGNSMMTLMYGRGFTLKSEWEKMKSSCCPDDPFYCDYSSYPDNSTCGQYVNLLQNNFYYSIEDPYNIYQTCYTFPQQGQLKALLNRRLLALMHNPDSKFPRRTLASGSEASIDNNLDMNWDSTDPFAGFPCFNADNLRLYLNRADVMTAIHARNFYPNTPWSGCRDSSVHKFFHYETMPKYYDMTNVFNSIMDADWYTTNQMRMLIYNGDVDTICQFLGDEWFIEKFVTERNLTKLYDREPWLFKQENMKEAQRVGGYQKAWSGSLQQVTVKGAGHFVPTDRPQMALQMILAFLGGSNNSTVFINTTEINIHPQPLLPQYTNNGTDNANCTQHDMDRVLYLPGLNFNPTFQQYSGYLKGSDTHRLHYWLIEAENSPETAPLLLWLNGGPGASSLEGLFEENGPFRLNPDGVTLSQNPYSWNRFANMLYLESPVGVGYSYSTDNQTVTYNDDNTLAENYAALKDFFMNAFPQYQTRPFFITGESYAGVYVPMLASKLIDGIKSNDIISNFQGLSLGNPVLSRAIDLNSLVHLLYYSGLVSYTEYHNVIGQCCPPNTDELSCQFSDRVTFDKNGEIAPPNNGNTSCYEALAAMALNDVMRLPNDRYNMYEDCYTKPVSGNEGFQEFVNMNSSDSHNAYYCYMSEALYNYLNLEEVKIALHVDRKWVLGGVFEVYTQQNPDVSKYLATILGAGKRVVIYNGDVDTACNWLGAEWFTTRYSATNHMEMSKPRAAWFYQMDAAYKQTVAGYQTKYSTNLDVLTVRGSGHFVPLDRPQQGLQLIFNFVYNRDYSDSVTVLPGGSTVNPPTQTVPTREPPQTEPTKVSATITYGILLLTSLVLNLLS